MLIARLLLLHFIADFILQPREMGKKKSQDVKWLLGHLAIQFAIFLPFTSLVFALTNCVIHGLIDWFIWRAYKLSVINRFPGATAESFKFWEDHLFFTTIGFDQLLHGLTLVFLARWFL